MDKTHVYDNDYVAAKLRLMGKLRKLQKQDYSSRAYYKAATIIENAEVDVFFIDSSFPGIGTKIHLLIKEILETGDIEELREKSEENMIVEHFQKIWSVGIVKAQQLYDLGFRSIDDILLRGSDHLTETQIFCASVWKDFKTDMDRKQMTRIGKMIKSIPELKSLNVKIVGSYRRGSQKSKDIDILIWSTSDKMLCKSIFDRLKTRFAVKMLACGERKLEFALFDDMNVWRRIDIFLCREEELSCALLACTGPFLLNIEMRRKAKEMGMCLNEKHLIDVDKKIIKVSSEKDIFDILEMEYLEPSMR